MTKDAARLPELTERQEKILALIVQKYINKPEPVGSKSLADEYLQNVSSATIRNDMAALEELGLVVAPHTSAGRVPTEAGYRYFVKRLLDRGELKSDSLTAEEHRNIVAEFSDVPGELDSWMRLAASTLARTSRGAAIVTAPRGSTSKFKHLALLSVQGHMVMMVLVLHGGYVRQQMLTLTEVLTQDALTEAANRLNAICESRDADEIRALLVNLERTADKELDQELLELVTRILDERDNDALTFYRDGLTELLPEFPLSEAAQQAARIMEETALLTTIMSEFGAQGIGDVQVVIAGDGRRDDVRHLSMVLSRYGVAGGTSGALAVLGPTRMRYERAISAVRVVAGVMTNLLVAGYGYGLNAGDKTSNASD